MKHVTNSSIRHFLVLGASTCEQFHMTIVAAIVTPEGVWMGADSLASSTEIRVESVTPKVYRSRNFPLATPVPTALAENSSESFALSPN